MRGVKTLSGGTMRLSIVVAPILAAVLAACSSGVDTSEVDATLNLWSTSNQRLMDIDTSTLGSGADDFFVTAIDFRAYAGMLRSGIEGVPTEVTTDVAVALERAADGLEAVSACFSGPGGCDSVVADAGERQYELGLAMGELAKYGTVDVNELMEP